MFTLGTLRTRALVGSPGRGPQGVRGGGLRGPWGSLGAQAPHGPRSSGPSTDAGAQGVNLIDRWLLVYIYIYI